MSRYIDADRLYKDITRSIDYCEDILEIVERQPAADVAEVVRCKDCKYQNKGQNECESWNMCKYRSWLYFPVNDDDYCSKGERNE